MLFALSAQILRSPKLCNWIITSFLLTALMVSAYGIRQEFFGVQQLATWNDPSSALANDTRVYSYLGNPNLLGGYLLPAIALSVAAVFIWQGWIQKTLAVIMVGCNSACLYFTDSRGAWLANGGINWRVAITVLLLVARVFTPLLAGMAFTSGVWLPSRFIPGCFCLSRAVKD